MSYFYHLENIFLMFVQIWYKHENYFIITYICLALIEIFNLPYKCPVDFRKQIQVFQIFF